VSHRPRIFADFNDLLSSPERVWLDTVGARDDLDRLGLELVEGLVVTVYDHDHDLDDNGNRDDLLADAVVARDADSSRWVAIVDRTTMRHASVPAP
jgi:hypothetical protein